MFATVQEARIELFVVAFLLILTTGGCTTTTYNAFLSDSGMRQFHDIKYGKDDRHRLDVYRPHNLQSERPVVVFVHGGAWNRGNKEQYFFVARSLVDRGYVAVLPNYRLYPEVAYPNFIDDTAKAVAWTLENIEKYGGSSESVFLMGHSAGAYNAAMVAYADKYLDRHKFRNEQLKGFIGLAGLYDFLPIKRKHLVKIFGGTDRKERTQPVNYVDETDPPALLIHGKNDVLVSPNNSRSMRTVMKKNGTDGEIHVDDSLNHVYLVLSMGPYFRGDYETLNRVDTFIKNQTTPRSEFLHVGP